MCYRHREYTLRLCCCQGYYPTVKPEGVQPGLTVPGRPCKITFMWLKIQKRDCIICENNLHNTNLLLKLYSLWISTEFVVNIMFLFKLYGEKTKDAELHSQHISLSFRQSLMTQCILNSRSYSHKGKGFFLILKQSQNSFLFPWPFLSPSFPSRFMFLKV